MNKNKLFIIISAVVLSTLVIAALIWKKDTIPPEPTEPDDPCLNIGVHIYDIEEYNSFIETESKLPDNFVTADMLKEFGTFKGFVCNSETDFSVYGYWLVLENGYENTLLISHTNVQSPSTNTKISMDKTDSNMLTLSTKETGNITVNGIEYHYIKGELLTITWQENNIRFEMQVQQLSDYPKLPSSSIMGKLISVTPEDQKSALKYFSEITQNKMQSE